MRERAELSLKVLCWALVAVLLFQLGRAIVRNDPFRRVTIPDVPTLATAPNLPAPATGAADGTIVASSRPADAGTNVVRPGTNQPGANLVMVSHSTNSAGNPAITNFVAGASSTNVNTNLSTTFSGTNRPGPLLAGTATNAPLPAGTNYVGTNQLAAAGHKKPRSHYPPMTGMGGSFMPGGGVGQPLPDLPPVARARIDKIVNSELLGPVFHPVPKALMGIAGNVAFLRTDSGQTGLVKEGDTLGDLKLLRIGINRVLVEQNGQKQELTIFDGMGGESLLTTPDNNSNETKLP